MRIDSVLDNTSGRANCFTPGGQFTIAGAGFGDHTDLPGDIGVYLLSRPSLHLERARDYERWSDVKIVGTWPAVLRGPQQLFVEVREDELIRSSVHIALLIPIGPATGAGEPSDRGDAAGATGGNLQRREVASDSQPGPLPGPHPTTESIGHLTPRRA